MRGALGENLAFIFLPIIAAGMYELYVKRTDNWFLLAFGVTGLMYAHMLSLVMVLEFLVGGYSRVGWHAARDLANGQVHDTGSAQYTADGTGQLLADD